MTTLYSPEQILHPPVQNLAFKKFNALAFSLEGCFLAVGIGSSVYVWETLTWRPILCYQKAGSVIVSVAWDSRDCLYFGCNTGWLTIVAVTADKPYHSEGFRASQKSIKHIAINNAASRLALGGEDKVTLWSSQDHHQDPYHDWKFIRKLRNPQDENDEMHVVVTGIEWAHDYTMHLVVSYLNQGIVTWDTATYRSLFETGQIVSDNMTDPVFVLSGGSMFYAVPSEKQIRIYERCNGSNYRCLRSPERISHGSPMVWAHQGTCILAALRNKLVLWHLERRDQRVYEIPDHQHITHLAWGRTPTKTYTTCRMAAITDFPKAVHIWRLDGKF